MIISYSPFYIETTSILLSTVTRVLLNICLLNISGVSFGCFDFFVLSIYYLYITMYINKSPWVSLAKTSKRLDRFEYCFMFVRYHVGIV